MPSMQKQPEGTYHRPGYLRTLGAYENVKKSYEYCRGFVGVRTLAPVVEWVAEGTLSRVPIVKNLKENASEDGYPMLHGLDNRLAELLKHFDDYVDVSVADPTSLQGRALRAVTHTVHAAAGYTPFVGGQIRRLMIEIDPDHMSRAPRLMDRPALDTTSTAEEAKGGYEQEGSEQEGRGSIDGETDDVSVMTDETSDEAAERQGKKKTKAKRKDKRFLQNMGKGIKKVMNYPRTPVHELPPDIVNNNGRDSPSPSIGTEEAVAATPSPAISSSGGDSTTSSTSSGTPMRSTSSRKFFGSGSKKSAESPAAASTSSS